MAAIKLTRPVPPGSLGKSKDGASPPNNLDLEVELSDWKELLQDVMNTVDNIDMVATLQILKDTGLSKPSKALGIEASDVKDMKGFENLSMAQRGILRFGVAAVQVSTARTTTTAIAVATPQCPRSSEVHDAISNLAGRDASEAMVVYAVSSSESKNIQDC